MKYKLIKELYDCFYTPPELSAPRQEIEECHKTLIEVLEKPERILPSCPDTAPMGATPPISIR